MTETKFSSADSLSRSPDSQKISLDKWAKWLLHQRFQDRPPEERRKAIELLETIRNQVLNNARIQPQHHVLDLGTGTGLLTLGAIERISSEGHITAVDISADSLRVCQDDIKSINANVNFAVANGLALPFQSNVFDAIVIRSVFIYVTDKMQMLSECYRVLKNEGVLSLFEPINRDRTPNVDFSKLSIEVREHITRQRQDLLDQNDPMVNFGIEHLINYAEISGFTDIRTEKDTVKEELTDTEAIDRYLSRVPAPGRLSPKEYYIYHLGDSGFHTYRQRWIDSLDDGPVYIQTPIVYLSAQKKV